MSAPELTRDLVESTAAYIDTWWAFRRRHHRLPGVQGAIGLAGDVLLSTAHGLADEASGTPMTTGHVFRVASHSKTFTATLVWQLHERGVLRVDDPLRRWLAWLPSVSAPVAALTLRELLGHTGGITRDGPDGDQWQLRRPFHDAATLREVVADAVVTAPHVRFKYSNIGYALLGLIVEAATGTSWADALRAGVLDPLGLDSTSADLEPGSVGSDRIATGYTSLAYADVRVPIDQVSTGAMAAATGVCSTAEDLLRYVSAHTDDRLLSAATRRQMQHAGWEVGGTPGESYGLGFAVSTVGERRLVGHGGGWPGHTTRTLLDPDARLAVSVLINAIAAPALELAVGAVALLDLAAAPTRHAVTDPAERAVAADVVGRWATLWGVQDLALLGDRLVLLDPSTADPTSAVGELAVLDADTLQVVTGPGYGSVGETVRLSRDEQGRVTTLRTGSGMTTWRLAELPLPARVSPGAM